MVVAEPMIRRGLIVARSSLCRRVCRCKLVCPRGYTWRRYRRPYRVIKRGIRMFRPGTFYIF